MVHATAGGICQTICVSTTSSLAQRSFDRHTQSAFVEGVNPPKQARSAATFRRILEATERLLETKSFEEITVQEICAQANVAVASVYSRFESKNAILATLCDELCRTATAQAEAATSAAADFLGPELDLEAIARLAVHSYADLLRPHRRLVESLMAHPALWERYQAVSEPPLRVASAMLLGSLPDEERAEAARRLNVIIGIIGPLCLRAFDPESYFQRCGMTEAEILEEFVQLTVRYFDR